MCGLELQCWLSVPVLVRERVRVPVRERVLVLVPVLVPDQYPSALSAFSGCLDYLDSNFHGYVGWELLEC